MYYTMWWFIRSALSDSCDTVAAARQAPLFMEFSRQEYWFSPPGDLPHPGVGSASLVSPALADEFFTTSAT